MQKGSVRRQIENGMDWLGYRSDGWWSNPVSISVRDNVIAWWVLLNFVCSSKLLCRVFSILLFLPSNGSHQKFFHSLHGIRKDVFLSSIKSNDNKEIKNSVARLMSKSGKEIVMGNLAKKITLHKLEMAYDEMAGNQQTPGERDLWFKSIRHKMA